MSYQFPPDVDERVKLEMSRRGLESEDDVLREALDALRQLEENKLSRWQERNAIAIEQSRLGLSAPLDIEAVLARVEQRLASPSPQ